MKDAKVYAVDPEGNKYEPTYFMYEEMTERGHLFAITSYSFTSTTPLRSVLGDVLEECGYFDEQPDLNVTLESDKYELKVGETLNLTATPPVDYVEFEYEFSVRGENDDEWTVIQERSASDLASWTPEEAGNYGVKVRIFYDEIDYIWQDNKTVVVNPSDIVEPGEPENPENPDNPEKPGDGDNNGDNSQKPGDNNGNGNNNGTNTDKPSADVKPDSPTNGKLSQTGGANALMTLAVGLVSTIGGALSMKKRK